MVCLVTITPIQKWMDGWLGYHGILSTQIRDYILPEIL